MSKKTRSAGGGRRRNRREGSASESDATLRERERIRRLGYVARQYWQYEQTQEEIAKDLRVNTSTVTRLLADARKVGIVQIHIDEGFAVAGEVDELLSKRLRDEFELDDATAVSVL